MIVTTAQLYKVAYGKFAVGAYNINNMEQLLGLFGGNVQSRAPFIIQLSKGARKYADKRMLEGMIRTAQQMYPEAIFAVHLDHGDEEACYDCIDSGFYSSVMIDASREPFDENVAITKRVVDRAHPAARLGVTKMNIDTDGRLVRTRVHREYFRDHPEQFDFRAPGKIFVKEYADFIAHKNEKLGSAGQLDTVRASLKK
jgi:fructose/tagatose bisphosphate aldolase